MLPQLELFLLAWAKRMNDECSGVKVRFALMTILVGGGFIKLLSSFMRYCTWTCSSALSGGFVFGRINGRMGY